MYVLTLVEKGKVCDVIIKRSVDLSDSYLIKNDDLMTERTVIHN